MNAVVKLPDDFTKGILLIKRMTLSDTPTLSGHLVVPGSTFIPTVQIQHIPWNATFNVPPTISDTEQVVWKNLDIKVPCKASSLTKGHLDVEFTDTKTHEKIGRVKMPLVRVCQNIGTEVECSADLILDEAYGKGRKQPCKLFLHAVLSKDTTPSR